MADTRVEGAINYDLLYLAARNLTVTEYHELSSPYETEGGPSVLERQIDMLEALLNATQGKPAAFLENTEFVAVASEALVRSSFRSDPTAAETFKALEQAKIASTARAPRLGSSGVLGEAAEFHRTGEAFTDALDGHADRETVARTGMDLLRAINDYLTPPKSTAKGVAPQLTVVTPPSNGFVDVSPPEAGARAPETSGKKSPSKKTRDAMKADPLREDRDEGKKKGHDRPRKGKKPFHVK